MDGDEETAAQRIRSVLGPPTAKKPDGTTVEPWSTRTLMRHAAPRAAFRYEVYTGPSLLFPPHVSRHHAQPEGFVIGIDWLFSRV